MQKSDEMFTNFIADVVKQSPASASRIRQALELMLVKSVASGGQDSTYGADVLNPTPAPKKPPVVSTTFTNGDKVKHKPSGKSGEVAATVGSGCVVQFLDGSAELCSENDLERQAAKTLTYDQGREFLAGLAKTITPSKLPFAPQ
jgi:hypothetical protein